MSREEFHEDLKHLLRQHPELDAEDLRDTSNRFEQLADQREQEEAVF